MQRDSRYKASQHFVWRQELSDILGEGAFGTVFKGVHKETGEPVAVKTFNRSSSHRIGQIRELDIIRRLDHPNIVKLIAIEEVLKPRRTDGSPIIPAAGDNMQGKVLIMELCTEESLYTNLDRPENQFGLEESEFLLVIAHMTSGMRYLHENKIIHRDWKPSNILKTVTEDGEIFYKLCDFGAARVCEENGQFMSIVGTEEYLHPEIYRRALLGGSNGVFMATSDLWSVGVTLYQTATALLPFRPFGGRKNREVMHKMTTEKESGVIAGYQETENGPIHWRKELPLHCLLSSGLRPHVTKLLAGLLESKQPLLWNYERYFHEVAKILSKISIRFYVLGESGYRTVYLDRTADFYALRDGISSQINIPLDDYALFINGNLLEADTWDIVDVANDTKSLLIVVPLNGSGYQPTRLFIPINPVFDDRERSTLDWDVDTAKTCLSVARWIAHQLSIRRSLHHSIVDSAAEIKLDLAKRLHSSTREWSCWKFAWSTLGRHLGAVEKWCPSVAASGVLAAKHSSAQLITQTLSSIEKQLANLKVRCAGFANLEIPSVSSATDSQESLAVEKTLGKMETIYTQFRKDKAMRMDNNPDTYHNDLKWHSLQRKQLKEHWEWCKEQFDGAGKDRFNALTTTALDYHQNAYQLAKTLADIELGIRNVEEITREFSASLDKLPIESQPTPKDTPKREFHDGARNVVPKDHSSSLSTCLESTKLPGSFLDMVRDIQEMRLVIDQDRQVLERVPATVS